ncbi:AraC family transcriptional regulator [Saccharobesus litoralis]|uniref:AraC family transcriptional regulator n=1 Tax=Saccharobesus litoralis TaxID=2172099 RepID=A0A2S0VXW1_9ALTE|nr:AraC family transcriptional regulator [Saccharobesus litoralis]
MKTADEPELATELEKIKQQVIQLNRDLFVLEEDLLFPASTQVSVFVSVDVGRFFKLDSVEVKINGKNVAGFLYTDRQRFALEQGGIQRLYQGNLKEGEHELTAIFTGVDADNRDAKRAAVYTFEKDDEAIMIELKLQDNSQDYRAEVVVDEWVL